MSDRDVFQDRPAWDDYDDTERDEYCPDEEDRDDESEDERYQDDDNDDTRGDSPGISSHPVAIAGRKRILPGNADAASRSNEGLSQGDSGIVKADGTPWRSSVDFVNEAQKEIEWLIPGILPVGAVVLLSGREGCMKSFLAMTMGQAVAAGVPWLGRPTQHGTVLYLDGEMPPAVLQDRLRGIGPVESLRIWSWTYTTYPYHLDDPQLVEAAKQHRLIVVDTLRRHMMDLNELSSDDMAKITYALRELTRYGATVLVLHHAPKNPNNKTPRGSTELAAGADISMHLTKNSKGGKVYLDFGNSENAVCVFRRPDSDQCRQRGTSSRVFYRHPAGPGG